MSESIGKQLKEARLKRGLTFDDIAHETRINETNLVGLESDDYSGFPGLAYARSFLGIYSEYLGVDASDTLEAMHDPHEPAFQAGVERTFDLTPQDTRIPVIKGIPEPLPSRSIWVPILGFALMLLMPTMFIFGKKIARIEIEESLRGQPATGLVPEPSPGDTDSDPTSAAPVAPTAVDPVSQRRPSDGSLPANPLKQPDPDPELNAFIGIGPP